MRVQDTAKFGRMEHLIFPMPSTEQYEDAEEGNTKIVLIVEDHPSINSAKRRSRQLQREGKICHVTETALFARGNYKLKKTETKRSELIGESK